MFYIQAASKESVCKLRTLCVACVMSLNIYLVSPKLSGICPLPTLLSVLVSQSFEHKCTAKSNECQTCAVTQINDSIFKEKN